MNATRNTNFKNNNANNSKKPYCKVCHDAGKPESMYTSHCVKSYNINTGKTDTTCPTLLALECRYCYKSGHTVKFCPVLEENKKIDNQRSRDRTRQQVQQQVQQAPAVAQKNSKNAFAALADDSDDEHEQVLVQAPVQAPVQAKQEVDDFPALMGNTRVAQNNNVKSYSCVASTPADERRLEMLRKERLATQKKAVSWADADESDSEGEYEVEDEEVEAQVTSVYVQPSAPSSYTYAPRVYAEDDDW